MTTSMTTTTATATTTPTDESAREETETEPAAEKEGLRTGTSVTITGTYTRHPRAQQPEIRATSISILGPSPTDYPIQKKYHTAEFTRTIPHLRPRTAHSSSILRMQSTVLYALSTFFSKKDYFQTLPPILTTSDCEGAGETFSLMNSEAYFGKKTYLTVSTQLHLEALAMGLGRVWTITPVFRAERSLTSRHLAEFRMVEVETCFVGCEDDASGRGDGRRDGGLREVMDLVEEMIRAVTLAVRDSEGVTSAFNHSDVALDIDSKAGATQRDAREEVAKRYAALLAPAKWPSMTYKDAVTLLVAHDQSQAGDQRFRHAPGQGRALQAEHERWLANHVAGPVFVTHFPAHLKPFYMSPSLALLPCQERLQQHQVQVQVQEQQQQNTVACFDLLVPTMGELCGGSIRQHRFPALQSTVPPGLEWYAGLSKYGAVPHGGFGVGFERLVGYLGGVGNVREVSAFPRWVNHCLC